MSQNKENDATASSLKRIVICAVLIIAFTVTGCGIWNTDAKNVGPALEELPTHVSKDGIKYKKVEIEGRTFIATQSAWNYWTLSGPID